MASGCHLGQHWYGTFLPSQKVLLDSTDLSRSIYINLTNTGQYQINFFGEYLCSPSILRWHFHTIQYSTDFPLGSLRLYICFQFFATGNKMTLNHFITKPLHHSLFRKMFLIGISSFSPGRLWSLYSHQQFMELSTSLKPPQVIVVIIIKIRPFLVDETFPSP